MNALFFGILGVFLLEIDIIVFYPISRSSLRRCLRRIRGGWRIRLESIWVNPRISQLIFVLENFSPGGINSRRYNIPGRLSLFEVFESILELIDALAVLLGLVREPAGVHAAF